eukprot:TRINITY_DN7682_c0_g1_i1.p1 TRINITY_DN7682_c0_g1~~TRINITY_DN7682_c0_g1_i1.p1  ORF type:complete len:627 (+),score=133.26 TRINITY_DN7682_c0_g1_i1:66-1883(+)
MDHIKNEEKGNSGMKYKLDLAGKSLFLMNTGPDTRSVIVQLQPENLNFQLPYFVHDQAVRWKNEDLNIFENILSIFIKGFISQAEIVEETPEIEDNNLIEDNLKNDLDFDIADNEDIDFTDGVEDNKENINDDEDKNLELEKADNNNTDKSQDEEIHEEEPEGGAEVDQDAYSKLELELKEEVDELSDLNDVDYEATLKKKINKKGQRKPRKTKGSSINDVTDDVISTVDHKERVKCHECGAWLAGQISLKIHIQTIHMNIRNFRCNICRKEYSTLTMIKKHMKTAHDSEEDDYSYLKKEREDKSNRFCGECDLWFDTTDLLVDHVISSHPMKPDLLPPIVRKRGPLPWSRTEAWERPEWTCPLCTEEPIYRTDSGADGMVGHFRLSHPDNLLCWVCGQAFNTSQGKAIYEHMKAVHPMKAVFACTTCGLYNRTKKLLTSHNKLHTKKGTSVLHCEECTYTTLRTDLLKIHKKIHERVEDDNKAKLVCDECGGLFKSKPAHRKHVKIFHSKTEGTHECKECNKKFFQRHSLVEHMNIHRETKAFSCEFCAQTFAMFSSLTKHRKRKHGELIGKYPEHSCRHCEKKFWQPKELKTHVDREHSTKVM